MHFTGYEPTAEHGSTYMKQSSSFEPNQCSQCPSSSVSDVLLNKINAAYWATRTKILMHCWSPFQQFSYYASKWAPMTTDFSRQHWNDRNRKRETLSCHGSYGKQIRFLMTLDPLGWQPVSCFSSIIDHHRNGQASSSREVEDRELCSQRHDRHWRH